MALSEDEIRLFYKVFFHLIWAVNEKNKFFNSFNKPVYQKRPEPIEGIIKVRAEIWEKPHLINDVLIDSNYNDVTEEERQILENWYKYAVKDKFFVIKHLPRYSVLIDSGDQPKIYGVNGISSPLSELFAVSTFIEAVLLPFKNKIIFDGMAHSYQISFGKSIYDSIEKQYKDILKNFGIYEQLNGKPPVLNKPKRKKTDQAK